MCMDERVGPWLIRDAREEDLPAIVAIYNASIPSRLATADLEPVTVESRRDWFHKHGPGMNPLWVALEGEVIAGWVCLSPFYGRPAYRGTREVSLYIDPRFHRRGLGALLFGRMIDHSPKLGVRTLLSFVFAHNEASVRLNEKFGFERWACLPGVADLDGLERDVVIFGRRVGAGP